MKAPAIESFDVSGNSFSFAKKKKKTHGYQKHLDKLQRVATASVNSIMNYLPPVLAEKPSSKKSLVKAKNRPSTHSKHSRVSKKQKALSSTSKKKSKSHSSPEEIRLETEASIALRNKRRLLNHLVQLIMKAKDLKEVGLIKVGLDADSCDYIEKRLLKTQQESETKLSVRVMAELNGLPLELEKRFCGTFLE